jgi:hypothetical protein
MIDPIQREVLVRTQSAGLDHGQHGVAVFRSGHRPQGRHGGGGRQPKQEVVS